MQESIPFFKKKPREKIKQDQENGEVDWLKRSRIEEQRKELQEKIKIETDEGLVASVKLLDQLEPEEIFKNITTNENVQEIAVHLYNMHKSDILTWRDVDAFWETVGAEHIEKNKMFAEIFMMTYFETYYQRPWMEKVARKAVKYFGAAEYFINEAEKIKRFDTRGVEPWIHKVEKIATETMEYTFSVDERKAIQFTRQYDTHKRYGHYTEESMDIFARAAVLHPFAAHSFIETVRLERTHGKEESEYAPKNWAVNDDWAHEPEIDDLIQEAEETIETCKKAIEDNATVATIVAERLREYQQEEWPAIVPEYIEKAIEHYTAAEIFIEETNRAECRWRNQEWTTEYIEKAKTLRDNVAKEARERWSSIAEKEEPFTLTKEEFDRYFGSKEIQQTETGNCYAVSAIYAMRRWPQFEIVARKSMKKNPDGSWEVHLPFMNEQGETVIITQEEIQPQKNENFGKKHPLRDKIDTRKTIDPIDGPEGYQVLEAAYLKKGFGSVDRAKSDKGGIQEEVLSLFGDDMFSVSHIIKLPLAKEKSFITFFENFNPDVYIATCSGLGEEGDRSKKIEEVIVANEKENTAQIRGVEILMDHAYAIIDIDTEAKMVGVVNPHDTKEIMALTLEQFTESFDGISVVRVDNEKLVKAAEKAENQVPYNYETR